VTKHARDYIPNLDEILYRAAPEVLAHMSLEELQDRVLGQLRAEFRDMIEEAVRQVVHEGGDPAEYEFQGVTLVDGKASLQFVKR
jgi:hypothetical protein